MSRFKRSRTSRPVWLITIVLLAGLLPPSGGVRAGRPRPTPTPTRAPFAHGVSFLAPDGQVGTTYRGAQDSASALATADPAELAAEALARVNDARHAAGLPPLLSSEALTAAASEHAGDLQSSGTFRHRGSNGSWPADRAARHGHPTTCLGENLAVGHVTAQATVDAWLADDGSQANLLDPRFTHAGLALAHNGPWHNYWVLILGDSPAYRPGRVLVRFQPSVAAASVQKAMAEVNATSLGRIGSLDVERLAIPLGQEAAVVAALQQNPTVAFAEPDYRVHAAVEPDDPYYAGRWWWENIQAADAWNIITGSNSVTIAVIDTGVDLDHPDLAAKIVPGKDFVNGDGDSDADDDHGHGTHVAGIAAAVTNNGIGVAGLSWEACIMPVKVLDSDGNGWISDVAEGISYAADNGAKVINLSLGAPTYDGTMAAATDYAHGEGVFIAAAAGNDGKNQLLYPAANEHVVGVAATTSSDTRASFSNYGPHVDVAAPGLSIYSTGWTGDTRSNCISRYCYKSGTSMATPFVSGLAALVLSMNSDLSPDEVETIIEQTADDLGAPGRDDKYGWGRVNAYQAVLLASSHALEGAVYDLEGHGVAGVSLTIAGSQTFTATTGGDGHFSRTGLPQGTYVVTPALANLTFSPLTRTVVISGTDLTGITYTAQVSGIFAISGTVRTVWGDGLPDVQIVTASDYSSTGSGHGLCLPTQTDAHGHFTQTGLISGTYVLTPTLSGATFEPPTRTVVVTAANRSGVDFTRNDFRAHLAAVFHNFSTTVFPDDPYFENGTQWGLHNTGQSGGTDDADIDAPEAWGLSTGDSSVIVAIVDSGVDLDHPEFSGRLTDGWDFVNGDGDPDDDEGHGSHVTGIAAATGDNSIGVAGVAWGVRIMPLKVLHSDGSGYDYDVAQGIRYAADHGAKVINLSLSGPGESSTLQSAVDYAYAKGVLVVAAAGNCRTGCWIDEKYYVNPPSYPAASAHTLGVAATTNTDTYSSFSNYGPYVDVAAPGSSIHSTLPGSYGYESGTSMATPFVAGLAGLIYSRYPSYTPDQVAQAIVHNADDLGTPGRDDTYGCGRINAYRSLANGAVSSGCAGWSGLSVESTYAPAAPSAGAEFRPGALLIKFQDAATLAEREDVLAAHGLTSLDAIEGLDIHLVAVPEGQELALVERLNANPVVAYAEPDYKVYALPLWPRPPASRQGEPTIQ